MATLYTYDLTPKALVCGATANMTLTVLNGGAAQTGGTRTIYISIPTGSDSASLTNSPSAMSLTATQDTTRANWAGVILNGVSGYNLKLQGPPLAANQILTFALNTVVINSEPGPVILPVTEQFTSPQGSGAIQLAKDFATLQITSFNPEPAYTSVPGDTSLNWDVEGGSQVELLPLNVTLPTEGTGSSSGTYPVRIVAGPSTNYTLRLWNDNHQYVSANTIAYAGPVTASLSNSCAGPVDLDAPVTFTWTSNYAQEPLYFYPTASGTKRVNGQGAMTITPGALLSTNASSLTFTLQANGWTGTATGTVTIPSVVIFNPLEILYLRYADATKTSVIWGARNYIANQTSLVTSGGVSTLTTNGPTGPLTQRLGDVPDLQVQLFLADPSSPEIGDTVTLTYETANATGVTINGEAVEWEASTQQGSTTIPYNGPSTLVMVASGSDGDRLSSQLTLPYTTYTS
ncbi:MAG: hypothetical protein K9H25_06010 [Rhodospirillum sp.]|nr:hypothetical protein [Rhodospirillum sp.]MCF8491401.1 hypothetical protein [Rhodospirillum sp.]MCF8501463.1 hypothetical protein [Rhodospirillum sp.]